MASARARGCTRILHAVRAVVDLGSMDATRAINDALPAPAPQNGTAPPSASAVAEFREALRSAMPIRTKPKIEGDLDDNGEIDPAERFALQLRNQIERLQQQLEMQELTGDMTADQRTRLMRGIVALGRLLANVHDRIENGEDVPVLDKLQPQATEILMAATSGAPADKEPKVKVPVPRDAERAYEVFHAKVAQRLQDLAAS